MLLLPTAAIAALTLLAPAEPGVAAVPMGGALPLPELRATAAPKPGDLGDAPPSGPREQADDSPDRGDGDGDGDRADRPKRRDVNPEAHHAEFRSPQRVTIPKRAPWQVRRAIRAANRITDLPYVYGGGHGSFTASGYDCSGTVSYALNGGKLLDAPLASGGLASWGEPGEGKWITVYANASHAFVVIAGRRLDTSAVDDPGGQKGPRWRAQSTDTSGYVARHPAGL
jgi:cell wall-associated NlpC family hydrolase